MTTATLDEQLAKAQQAEGALVAEIEEMEARVRHLSFDAVGDAKARNRLSQLESDLDTRRRMLRMSRTAIAEGERRQAVRTAAQVAAARGALETERVRLHTERDAVFQAFEEAIETIQALVGTATALDATLKNVEVQLDVPRGRHARDVLARYATHHLARAGLRFDFPYHEMGGRPISDRRTQGERAAALAATTERIDAHDRNQ